MRNTNRALAAVLAFTLVFGSASVALAKHGNDKDKHRVDNENRTSAKSCINPAGNMRGWCKQHAQGSFINGTVTSINGNTAIVRLANGQQVSINQGYLLRQGHGLRVGQNMTLRGSWQNGVFVVNNGVYNNGGSYSGSTVSGLIVSINGNSLRIAQGLRLITINDSNAAARGAISGGLYVGRSITATGNWNGSAFVANSIQ